MDIKESIHKIIKTTKELEEIIKLATPSTDDKALECYKAYANKCIDEKYPIKEAAYFNISFKQYYDQILVRRRADHFKKEKYDTQSPYDASKGGWGKLK